MKRYLCTFLVLVRQSECWISEQDTYLQLSASPGRGDKNHTFVIEQDSSITETLISDGLSQANGSVQLE